MVSQTNHELDTFLKTFNRLRGFFVQRGHKRYGLSLSRSEECLEDAYGRIVVRLLDGRVSHVKHWPAYIGKTHYNVICDLRRSKRDIPLDESQLPVDSGDTKPLEDLVAKEKTEIIHDEVGLLPRHYAEVLRLRLEGLSYRQIADGLALIEGTVDSRIHRASELLRKRLAKYN